MPQRDITQRLSYVRCSSIRFTSRINIRLKLIEALSVAKCLIVLGEMEKLRSTLDSLDHSSTTFVLRIRDEFLRILTDIPMDYRLLRSVSHIQLAEARQQKTVISQKEHIRRIAQDKALVP